jgi:hypothetical protein
MQLNFSDTRHPEFIGKGDNHLPVLIKSLAKLIATIENDYVYDTIKLDSFQKEVMATLIIEFAEDLHNEIGLWSSIEYYNVQFFKTPLPLFIKDKSELTESPFDKNRIKYFIYTNLIEFFPDLDLSPQHKDLEFFSNSVSNFIKMSFTGVPMDSGIKKFLSQSNNFGWDFKRKLVWTGLNSYLFRYSFYRYANEHSKGQLDIHLVDDFICQENTIWSGLGIIDILAKTLKLPEKIVANVSTWYERHQSYYKVISSGNNYIEFENMINNALYKVRETQPDIFKTGHLIFGGLVPYGDYWYWSGAQKDYGIVDEKTIHQLKIDFVKKSTRIVYRYDKELLKKANEDIKIQYSDFCKYFGNDLIVFKDGISLAAALQKKEKQKFESLPKKELEEIMKTHGLEAPYPKISFPDHLLNSEGVALYFNPDEGMEIMPYFNDVVNGLKKMGNHLTEDESDAIRNFIMSESISPNFVYRIIKDYGEQSILESFLIRENSYAIVYLLHKYKGHFYRNRYPQISYNIE